MKGKNGPIDPTPAKKAPEKHFHQLIMGGGPHSNGLEVYLDGMKLKGVTSIEVTANYSDAIKATISMIVEVGPSGVFAEVTPYVPLNIEELPPHIQQIASDLVALVEKQEDT